MPITKFDKLRFKLLPLTSTFLIRRLKPFTLCSPSKFRSLIKISQYIKLENNFYDGSPFNKNGIKHKMVRKKYTQN